MYTTMVDKELLQDDGGEISLKTIIWKADNRM
jgi:hypothetical protein